MWSSSSFFGSLVVNYAVVLCSGETPSRSCGGNWEEEFERGREVRKVGHVIIGGEQKQVLELIWSHMVGYPTCNIEVFAVFPK